MTMTCQQLMNELSGHDIGPKLDVRVDNMLTTQE
jgi:hypothetical protein